jgi:hypothetical protein
LQRRWPLKNHGKIVRAGILHGNSTSGKRRVRQSWYKTCQRATQINSPARSSFPFGVTHDLVITHGIELDMIDGIGAFDSNLPSLFEISQALHKDRQQYQTALGVFTRPGCMFVRHRRCLSEWLETSNNRLCFECSLCFEFRIFPRWTMGNAEQHEYPSIEIQRRPHC